MVRRASIVRVRPSLSKLEDLEGDCSASPEVRFFLSFFFFQLIYLLFSIQPFTTQGNKH